MEILTAAKRFPRAVVAGFSAVFRGVGHSIKPSEVTKQRCQLCGNMRMTKFVAFYRNVGMLFRRQTYTIMGNLCKTCVHKQFWKFEALDPRAVGNAVRSSGTHLLRTEHLQLRGGVVQVAWRFGMK